MLSMTDHCLIPFDMATSPFWEKLQHDVIEVLGLPFFSPGVLSAGQKRKEEQPDSAWSCCVKLLSASKLCCFAICPKLQISSVGTWQDCHGSLWSISLGFLQGEVMDSHNEELGLDL